MNTDASLLTSGFAQNLLFLALGIGGAIFVRSIRGEEKDRQHETALATQSAAHAKEVAVLTGGIQELRGLFERFSHTVNQLDKQIQLISATLIGVDGKNGIRGELRSLSADHRELRDRLLRLETRTARAPVSHDADEE